MKYVKNLIKILVIVQCLFFCACNKKEATTVETIVEPTEQNILNLADFVKCPFNEEFNNKTNLEKYVLKKFGKPNKVTKSREGLNDADEDIIVDKIWLEYTEKDPGDRYSFTIHRGISKRFEVFTKISIYNFIDIKYDINEETTIEDIENLFGKLNELNIRRIDNDIKTYYDALYNPDGPYVYHLDIGFKNGKLNYIHIKVNISASEL